MSTVVVLCLLCPISLGIRLRRVPDELKRFEHIVRSTSQTRAEGVFVELDEAEKKFEGKPDQWANLLQNAPRNTCRFTKAEQIDIQFVHPMLHMPYYCGNCGQALAPDKWGHWLTGALGPAPPQIPFIHRWYIDETGLQSLLHGCLQGSAVSQEHELAALMEPPNVHVSAAKLFEVIVLHAKLMLRIYGTGVAK